MVLGWILLHVKLLVEILGGLEMVVRFRTWGRELD
jgi:hypothetical protein